MILDERILILTSTRKDAETTGKILADAKLASYFCPTMEEFYTEVERGAGAVLIAREILSNGNLERLKDVHQRQPSWSDLPFIVLASAGELAHGKNEIDIILKAIRNTTILERPVRIATLVSVLESAIANRRRQYEVRNLVDQLQAAKEESDRANKTKSEFLANMSHEIRTPLAAVLGFSELALEENLAQPEREVYANSIKRNGQLLLALVNDILDLSKVEAGKIEVENIEVSIGEIIFDVVSSLKPNANQKKLELNVKVDEKVPAIALTDPVRVRQIISNLVGNAIKFTASGSVSIHAYTGQTFEDHFRLYVDVKDTGVGISPTQQNRLFQAFSQADSSTTRSFGGTGLGLVLSRQLARTLGGELVLVGSEPGKGSTFRVNIKVGRVDSNGVGAEVDGAGARVPPGDMKDLNVLLVEDSMDNQLLISRILQLAGARVTTANDGLEGVERAMHDDFDVVLMDVQMPRLDGNEATARLRKLGYTKPIVALTANALKGDKERARNAGFDDYLTKPLQRNKLFETLARYSAH